MADPLIIRVELIHERLEELLNKTGTMSTIEEDDLIKQISLVEECYEKLTSELRFYLGNSNQPSPEKIKLFTMTQFRAEEWKIEMKSLLKASTTTTTQSSSESGTHTKLPKLSLPKFGGDILQWSEFWDRFRSNIDQKPLPESEKMAYLLGCLEGQALQSVDGLRITNVNYTIAVNILKDRYGKQQKVVDAHYEAINNLQRAVPTASECRAVLSQVERHLRVLQALGEDMTGNHLRAAILSKFPEKVVYELHLLSSADKVDSIRSGLQKIISAMEMAKRDEAPSIPQPSTSQQAFSTNALYVKENSTLLRRKGKQGSRKPFRNSNLRAPKRKLSEDSNKHTMKKSKLVCIFCQGEHYNDSCTVIQNIEERKKKIGQRCYRCFKTGHQSAMCLLKKLCYYCKGKHNQALCPVQKKTGEGDTSLTSSLLSENESNKNNDFSSYLQTAIIKAGWQNHRRTKQCRLLLDSGSQRSYITTQLAKELELPSIREESLLVFVFGADNPVEIKSTSTELQITTRRGVKRDIQVNIVPHITDRIAPPMKIENVDIIADDGSAGDSIQVLIGSDFYYTFFRNEIHKIKDNLYMINTDFGWMIAGKAANENNENMLAVITYCRCQEAEAPYFITPDLPFREPDVKFLWSLENIGITDSPKITREEEAIKHFNETVICKDKKYEVKWPWIVYPPDLPTNYGQAYGRLVSLVRRLQKDDIEEYDKIFREQLAMGIIEVIDPTAANTHPVHYLPHHIVVQKGKRGRIVYDASCKSKNNKSLNENMYRGPSMLEDLTALLLKFRIHSIGITADIEKAFLQVGLQEEDRDVTRFLWLKDIKRGFTEDNILHLRFCRVPFGIIASPFLLAATIRHHLSKGNDSLKSEIAERLYVDNLVTGADTLEQAKDLIQKTREVFSELSMNMREWTSNSKQLMKSVPKQYRTKDTQTTKVLGLTWHLARDTLKLKVNDTLVIPEKHEKTQSKRKILQTLASLYDPCGFAAPLVLPAKLLIQELWKRKIQWDTPLPEDLLSEWQNALTSMRAAAEIEIPRYVGRTSEGDAECELHCFTDASKKSFAAVVYLRIIDKKGSSPKVVFIMAKSRVTPISHKEDLKIPKLELLGFVIGKRLLTYVKESLGIEIRRLYLWTDSEIVLCWMQSEKLLPPFVSRRINEIKQNKNIEPRYVNTECNPADLATRPELWHLKKQMWFDGPQFLLSSPEGWPSLRKQLSLFTSLAPEIDIAVADSVTQDTQDEEMLSQSIERIDIEETPIETEEASWPSNAGRDQSVGDTTQHLLNTGNESPTLEFAMPSEDVEMSVKEIHEVDILKKLQAEHFAEEVSGIETHLSRNLGLYVDVDGLLRSKGRIGNASCPYDTKHPILLPSHSPFTDQIIEKVHCDNYHVGVPHTLDILRNKYWIPQGRARVSKVLRKCPKCIKHGGGPYKLPPAAMLPPERVNYSNPFTYVGIDYMGPLFVETNAGKQKRWICLFTCLAIRAIHLEIVNDLTAEECLLALRRFIASRNLPKKIVSDNALYFKLVSEVLSNPYCKENGIQWKFIPQLAPWHGGVYERLVGLVKNCLKRTLEKVLLNDHQLLTVVKEVEVVINTRPLTSVGSEPEHVLKPADFLSFNNCLVSVPSDHVTGNETTTKIDLIGSWKRGHAVLGEFQKMFTSHYLTSLRERYSHSPRQPRVKSSRLPKIGDIVQLKDAARNRDNWKVGRISSLIKSADGQCRIAKVRIGDTEFTRSVGHLYPLEIEEEIQDGIETREREDSPVNRTIVEDIGEPGVSDLGSPANEGDQNNITVESQMTVPEEQLTNIENSDLDGKVVEVDREDLVANIDNEKGKRMAALRAREKIAQWTSQLSVLL